MQYYGSEIVSNYPLFFSILSPGMSEECPCSFCSLNFSVVQVDDRFYIYLEYVHPGSINKFIRDHCGAITESVVRNFTRHILCGLAYLHSKKTIHR